jgi:UPF0755 protein
MTDWKTALKTIFNPDQRTRKWIALGALAALVFGSLLVGYAYKPIDDRAARVTVFLPKGTGLTEIVAILDQAGMVKNRVLFMSIILIKRVAGSMKAGEYELVTSMTPAEIIDKIARGEIKIHEVTIPEDYTVKQIADLLVAGQLVREDAFFNAVTDPNFLKSMKVDASSAEGYLYPDTYQFNRSMTARDMVRIMVGQFWKKVTPQMLARAREIGLNTHEFVTLASLIGKETGYRKEKALVSAVFKNRLKKGMRLQCDPTAVYRLHAFQSAVRRQDIDNDTPYNTYKIKGLPPGPIANPGIDSLEAALYPAPVDYLYFVSNNDGTHKFSTSLAAHTKAVIKYQIKRKK